MSILDKKHILTIDLDDSSIEYSKKIFFYNTDKNISNLYVKIKKNNDDGVGVELSANDLKDITVKLTAIKPKTNQTREIIGILTEELTDQSCAIYKFELLQEFTDQVGSVVCEFELSNASGEKVTIDAFSYRIKESKLTGLNAEITSNPDLPVLKQLIKEVKETAQTVNNIDNTNVSDIKTYSNKKIEEKFSTVSTQIKEKVNQNQGSEYAGNYLGIAEDGNVVPMPVIGGGSGETTYELIGNLPQTTTFRPVQLLASSDTTITIGDNKGVGIENLLINGTQNPYTGNVVFYENVESFSFTENNGVTLTRKESVGTIWQNAYLLFAIPAEIGKTYTFSAEASDAYIRLAENDSMTGAINVSNPSDYAVLNSNNRQETSLVATKKYVLIQMFTKSKRTTTIDKIMITTDGTAEYKESIIINLTANEYYEYVNTVGETIPAPNDGTTVELYKKTTSGGADLSSLYTYVDNKVSEKMNKNGYTESGNLIVDENGNVAIENNSISNDKVYVFLGDSVPTFDSNSGGIGSITDYMQNIIGGTWHNFGIGGTTMASYRLSNNTYDMFTFGELADSIASGDFTNQETGITNGVVAGSTSYSASDKVADAKVLDWSTVDTICVHFGTNDLAYGNTLGTSDDTASKNGSICASLKYGIEKIHSVYPAVKIVICGIIYRNADGVPVSNIISANDQLKKTCYTEGVRFVDLFGEMEINQTNRTTFLYDGTHPNAKGKERYAECLARYIY